MNDNTYYQPSPEEEHTFSATHKAVKFDGNYSQYKKGNADNNVFSPDVIELRFADNDPRFYVGLHQIK